LLCPKSLGGKTEKMIKMDRRRILQMMAASAAMPLAATLPQAAAEESAKPESDEALAHRLAADPQRPQVHFLPAKNWMNDPNGPIYWQGQYHMFYQYNPHASVWGDMHWGHAVSADMIHWQHRPVSLKPTRGSGDGDGCFSGTAVVDGGKVKMLYTGVAASPLMQATVKDTPPYYRETQWLAVAEDAELSRWSKKKLLDAPPAGMEVNGFRDPSPWRQGDHWYMVLASGRPNRGGAILLYRSTDLESWEFQHILSERGSGKATLDSFDPFEVWECPEFFPLGDRHVLIFSTAGHTYWQSGKLDPATMRFEPTESGIVDYGSFYAAKTQLDAHGRRIIWGWIGEARPTEAHRAAGWAGMMALPRLLDLGPDGRLRQRIADEALSLRHSEHKLDLSQSEPGIRSQIDAIRLKAALGEITASLLCASEPWNLRLKVPGKNPYLTIGYHPRYREGIFVDGHPVSVHLVEEAPVELDLVVDGSVAELIVNQQSALTRRFYPKGEVELGLDFDGPTSALRQLSHWTLSPISPNRLTS